VLPPAPFDSLYDPAEIPIRYFDKGAYECRSAFDRPVADRDKLWELSKDQIRQVWKDYMGLCAYVDHEAGRVIDVLDELGLRENTIVVYSADHGKMLGEWGAGEKDVFDNEVWRVPFIWSWPGHIPEGKSRAEPCELIDTPRTLLSLAGLGDKIPPEYRGRDLFSDPAPDAVFGSIRSSLDPPESNAMRFAVRTDRYRMDVSWPIGGPRPRLSDCDGNLFDLTEDPFETRNVFGESEYKSAQMDLMDRIDSWLSGTEWDPRLLDPETAKTLY
jgi:arylsulfatase A-like enzyme